MPSLGHDSAVIRHSTKLANKTEHKKWLHCPPNKTGKIQMLTGRAEAPTFRRTNRKIVPTE